MLMAIYGLRADEVANLRLEDLDWQRNELHVRRVKRRGIQVYPLLPSVSDAIIQYLRGVRRHPSVRCEVFLSLRSPYQPISAAGLYHVAAPRLKRLGVQTAHHGPHCLRHACAGHLITEGLSLKEIGDHLGHRSTSATRTYTKVDLPEKVAAGGRLRSRRSSMRLHNVVEGYITFKRKLGVRLCSEAGVLRAFCRSVGETEVADIKAGAVLAFIAGKGPVTRSWKQRASVLRSFYRYAISRGLCTNSPLPTNAPKFPPPRTPHIYSTDELNRLLEATVRLQTPRAPLRAFSYRMLLLLLYRTGMRISEALSLALRDVDLLNRVLTIRDTKFFKTRLIPIGPKLTRELVAYTQRRLRQSPGAVNDSSPYSPHAPEVAGTVSWPENYFAGSVDTLV